MTLLESINLDLGNKLQEKAYRDIFFEDWANDEVAAQLRQLRKFRRLRQIDVAKMTGMKQSAVSRIEQSAYSRWNFSSLTRIAQALDARVRVTFEPAEYVIREYEKIEASSAEVASVTTAREAAAEVWENRDNQHHGMLISSSVSLAQQSRVSPEPPKFQSLPRPVTSSWGTLR